VRKVNCWGWTLGLDNYLYAHPCWAELFGGLVGQIYSNGCLLLVLIRDAGIWVWGLHYIPDKASPDGDRNSPI
jgi:hypothetical protein